MTTVPTVLSKLEDEYAALLERYAAVQRDLTAALPLPGMVHTLVTESLLPDLHTWSRPVRFRVVFRNDTRVELEFTAVPETDSLRFNQDIEAPLRQEILTLRRLLKQCLPFVEGDFSTFVDGTDIIQARRALLAEMRRGVLFTETRR